MTMKLVNLHLTHAKRLQERNDFNVSATNIVCNSIRNSNYVYLTLLVCIWHFPYMGHNSNILNALTTVSITKIIILILFGRFSFGLRLFHGQMCVCVYVRVTHSSSVQNDLTKNNNQFFNRIHLFHSIAFSVSENRRRKLFCDKKKKKNEQKKLT